MALITKKTIFVLIIYSLFTSLLLAQTATDLMSEALKLRSSGQKQQAINTLRRAVELAPSGIQRNLALFMLGDTQLEMKHFNNAIRTYETILNSVTSSEEKAEAIFRIMQAESGLNNSNKVNQLYEKLKNSHPQSPYLEIAAAFIQSEDLKLSTHEPAPPIQEAPREPVRVQQPQKQRPSQPTFEPKPKPEAKPERKLEQQPKPVARQQQRAGKQFSPEKAALIKHLLDIKPLEGAAKQELVTTILVLQDRLKDGPDRPGMDQVLFELAENTVMFGEMIEGCQYYDQILTHHPHSQYAERAYFEAIRLRAFLGVHQAVISWGGAFISAFPASEYVNGIRALIEYSRQEGNVDLSNAATTSQTSVTSQVSSNINVENARLKNDKDYKQAANYMSAGNYSSARKIFKQLADKYPNAPQIWWDIALLKVQAENFSEAEISIRRMLRLDADNQEASSLLDYILFRAGEI